MYKIQWNLMDYGNIYGSLVTLFLRMGGGGWLFFVSTFLQLYFNFQKHFEVQFDCYDYYVNPN